jgi:hypothetical protein
MEKLRFCFKNSRTLQNVLVFFKVFRLNGKVPLSLKKNLEHIKTFWFRYDPKLQYRNVCAFVSISLTLLEHTHKKLMRMLWARVIS